MPKKSKHQVVVFTAEWCPHCQAMLEDVWTSEQVKKTVSSYHGGKEAVVVCSKPQNRPLVDQFDIQSYPTIVIMDSDRNIKKRGKNMSEEELVEFLNDF